MVDRVASGERNTPLINKGKPKLMGQRLLYSILWENDKVDEVIPTRSAVGILNLLTK